MSIIHNNLEAKDVEHVRRLAEADGCWSVLPCKDNITFGLIGHEALKRFEHVIFFGRGREADAPYPLASPKVTDRFVSLLEALSTLFGVRNAIYGRGLEVTMIVGRVLCIFDFWDGHAESLNRVFSDQKGPAGFLLLGAYNSNLLIRRFR